MFILSSWRSHWRSCTDEKLPLPCDVNTDDPLYSGKKSQPSDVAVYVPEKSNYSSVKLSRKYYGVSGKHLKLSRKRGKLLKGSPILRSGPMVC